MKISLERTDNNFGMKAKAGNHEILLDSQEEGGASPMQLMLISLACLDLTIFKHSDHNMTISRVIPPKTGDNIVPIAA